MRILTIVGARPQFIKAAAVSPLLRIKHDEILLHTGQHYDRNMSDLFFEELGIPEPEVRLEVGSGSHAEQTAAMLIGIESAIKEHRPDWVMVYGDTNSTLAGALAAAKVHVPVAHVEAGLRSFNRAMPEEINRLVADKLSTLLFCPTQTAVNLLAEEGIREGVHLTGDVMGDILRLAAERVTGPGATAETLGLAAGKFGLVTIHRAENTDDPERLRSIFEGLATFPGELVFPAHPRTRQRLAAAGMTLPANLHVVDPVGYLEMVSLAKSARIVLTDSGGLQKEAFWLGTPCVTLREETEWVETLETGWNQLAGADAGKIRAAIAATDLLDLNAPPTMPAPAAAEIVRLFDQQG